MAVADRKLRFNPSRQGGQNFRSDHGCASFSDSSGHRRILIGKMAERVKRNSRKGERKAQATRVNRLFKQDRPLVDWGIKPLAQRVKQGIPVSSSL